MKTKLTTCENRALKYCTEKLLQAGGKVIAGVMVVHKDTPNGDLGVFYEFERKGSKWRMLGAGRARYAERSYKTAFSLEDEP